MCKHLVQSSLVHASGRCLFVRKARSLEGVPSVRRYSVECLAANCSKKLLGLRGATGERGGHPVSPTGHVVTSNNLYLPANVNLAPTAVYCTAQMRIAILAMQSAALAVNQKWVGALRTNNVSAAFLRKSRCLVSAHSPGPGTILLPSSKREDRKRCMLCPTSRPAAMLAIALPKAGPMP